jgi:hypothetical protein
MPKKSNLSYGASMDLHNPMCSCPREWAPSEPAGCKSLVKKEAPRSDAGRLVFLES